MMLCRHGGLQPLVMLYNEVFVGLTKIMSQLNKTVVVLLHTYTTTAMSLLRSFLLHSN